MSNAVRKSTRSSRGSSPCAGSRHVTLTKAYRALQAELVRLIGQDEAPYSGAARIRHALDGSIKLYDAILLAGLIAAKKPRRILEVGSFLGFSTRWLLERSRRWAAQVVSIDPDIRHRVFDRPGEILRRFNVAYLDTRLVPVRGFFSQTISGDRYYDYEHYEPILSRSKVDALIRKRPVLTRRNLQEAPFDLIFIDGDHSEGAVLSNFAEALLLLEPRGWIVFHDALSWPDVTRALGRVSRRYARLGEVEILGSELRQKGPLEACDGIGVFRRR